MYKRQVQLGRVYKNLMVDVRATNAKLRDRSVRIVMQATGLERAAAQALRGTLTERERQSAQDTRLVTTLCFSLSLLVTILLI